GPEPAAQLPTLGRGAGRRRLRPGDGADLARAEGRGDRDQGGRRRAGRRDDRQRRPADARGGDEADDGTVLRLPGETGRFELTGRRPGTASARPSPAGRSHVLALAAAIVQSVDGPAGPKVPGRPVALDER